jgi:hypothetical protein
VRGNAAEDLEVPLEWKLLALVERGGFTRRGPQHDFLDGHLGGREPFQGGVELVGVAREIEILVAVDPVVIDAALVVDDLDQPFPCGVAGVVERIVANLFLSRPPGPAAGGQLQHDKQAKRQQAAPIAIHDSSRIRRGQIFHARL